MDQNFNRDDAGLPALPASAAPCNESGSRQSVDWNRLIQPSTRVEIESWNDGPPTLPHVVSAKFGNRRAKVSSYFFTDAGSDGGAGSESKAVGFFDPYASSADSEGKIETVSSQSKDAQPSPETERTRIKPPSDVIRLEDRLFYLLQPPLETLLGGKTMEFPFEPFHFQYAGVAFLFPRHSAILADEMGLGKTMQAITTVRMLLRAGYIKNVLLICPKPLVTNWQREFKAWAPEITSMRSS